MDNVVQSKKRVQNLVDQLTAIQRVTTIHSVAVLPGFEEPNVVLFTDDAKISLSPDAAMRLGKHLLDMALIAHGFTPTLDEQEEKGIFAQ